MLNELNMGSNDPLTRGEPRAGSTVSLTAARARALLTVSIAALFGVLVIALAAAGAAQAVQKRIAPVFQKKVAETTIPLFDDEQVGPVAKALISHQVLLNKAGGGGSRTHRSVTGDPGRCSETDFVVALTLTAFPALGCDGGLTGSFAFLDPRLIKGPSPPNLLTGPKYSSTGNGVDSLRGNGRQLLRVVNRLAAKAAVHQVEALPGALRLQAAIGIMANPLSHRSARKALVEQVLDGERFSAPTATEDPRGRNARMISTRDQGHYDRYIALESGNYKADDTSLEQQLLFEPGSYELLATRTLLTATDVPMLRKWLKERGRPAELIEAVYGRAHQVRDRDFGQHRVPCEKLGSRGNNCIKLGSGGYASIG